MVSVFSRMASGMGDRLLNYASLAQTIWLRQPHAVTVVTVAGTRLMVIQIHTKRKTGGHGRRFADCSPLLVASSTTNHPVVSGSDGHRHSAYCRCWGRC